MMAQTVRPLTPQEKRIEAMTVQGMCQKDIATALHLTPGTVKVYLAKIYGKRGVRSMHQLTAMILWARIRELESDRGPSVNKMAVAS